MEQIEDNLLIATEDIEVYSYAKYDKDFLERLVNYYTKTKEKILNFFRYK